MYLSAMTVACHYYVLRLSLLSPVSMGEIKDFLIHQTLGFSFGNHQQGDSLQFITEKASKTWSQISVANWQENMAMEFSTHVE